MQAGYLFFALFMQLATPGRFAPLFYQAHQLTLSQIGFILAVPSLLSLPLTPLICHAADKAKSREHVLVATHLSSGIILVWTGRATGVPYRAVASSLPGAAGVDRVLHRVVRPSPRTPSCLPSR